MEFRVLGRLEVVADDGTVVDLGPRMVRRLLALLLLEPGAPVTVERIIDALWGDEPPATATNLVQVYVTKLRQAVGRERVESLPGAYRMAIAADQVDASRSRSRWRRGTLAGR